MSDTIVKFVHDTIFRVDTVLIANTALNSVKGSTGHLWTYFIPILASMVTSVGTLVLFVLTYRKDVKFNKEKYISEQNKYKFEKAHLKRVDLLEDLYCKLMEIESGLNFYYSLNEHFEDNFKKEFLEKVFTKLQAIREQFGSVRLFLGLDYSLLIKEIEENMGHIYLTLKGQNMNKNADVREFLLNVSGCMQKLEILAEKTINEENQIRLN